MKCFPKVLVVSVIVAQMASSRAAANKSSAPGSIATDASFEVASIKPSAPGSVGTDVDMDNDLLRMRNVSLKRCIMKAYGLPEAQIVGGPKWIDKRRYDIDAKADRQLTGDEVATMLQSLLADRFRLSLHRETRKLSGYALVVDKTGIKAEGSLPGVSCDMNRSRSRIHAKGCSMQRLAVKLAAVLGTPVVDATQLAGTFDFDLKWDPDYMKVSDTLPSEMSEEPSLFTAIQEQLGLKLKAGKVSTEVLVIEQASLPSAD